jgi:hypothetical protein
MEKENQSINLLGEKGKRTSDIILMWALYIGRLMVILTEVVALIVFLSRFSIDRKLIDLSDSIKLQVKYVELFKNGEETYRRTHLKLNVSQSNIASTAAVTNLYEDLMKKTNSQLNYSSLVVSPSKIIVTAWSPSADILAAFTQELKELPIVSSLSIDRVDSKPKSALISVTITAELQQKQK